jgi:protein-tyrosine phosphatase
MFLLLVWVGFGFFVTGLGHLGLGARIYAKNRRGVLPLWSKVLHLPFLLYTWGVWHVTRFFSREPLYDRITDSVTIGRRMLPGESSEAFSNWIDLTAEFDEPEEFRQGTNYISLPVLDGGVPSVQELKEALDRMNDGPTFIHCALGHGRSGIIALALLARDNPAASLEANLERLQKARPGLRLNGRQLRFIRRYLDAQRPERN